MADATVDDEQKHDLLGGEQPESDPRVGLPRALPEERQRDHGRDRPIDGYRGQTTTEPSDRAWPALRQPESITRPAVLGGSAGGARAHEIQPMCEGRRNIA